MELDFLKVLVDYPHYREPASQTRREDTRWLRHCSARRIQAGRDAWLELSMPFVRRFLEISGATSTASLRRLTGIRIWLDLLCEVLEQPDGIEAFLTFIEQVSETPASHLEDPAASLGPEAEGAYMTTADMLRTEGRTRSCCQCRDTRPGLRLSGRATV